MNEKKTGTENEPAARSTSARTCGNCAAALVMKDPRQIGAQILVCRLNPPTMHVHRGRVNTDKGVQEVQQMTLAHAPTDEATVCFQWKPPGTLPGDTAAEIEKHMAAFVMPAKR